MVELNLKYPEEAGRCPRLGQCYLCRAWHKEKSLSLDEIPDQVGYIQNLACQDCLSKVLNEVKSEV